MVKQLIKKIIPDFLLSFYHYSLAIIGAFLYGFPSQKLTVIGITGTSGKSTVVELAVKIFEEAGFRVASLSSIKFKIGDKEWENKLKMTMPGRFKIQRFLKKSVKAGCSHVILEVTSEGIKQFRHKFIKFDIALLTNLSPEHIEAHGGFEKYRACKGKLFEATKKIHIINLDDENAEYFIRYSAEKKWGYTTKIFNFLPLEAGFNKFSISNFQTIFAENIQQTTKGINFSINNVNFDLKLLGDFNLYNAVAVSCVGLSQGISLDICRRALEKVKGIPGRMEIVIKEPFTVIVDYAHTPEELKNVYEFLRNWKLEIGNWKLICVLGACGGGRDKWKRPVLGKLAAQYCQEVIVTNEDPYDENPNQILSEIKSGISNFYEILDRREAIRKALELAKQGDVVVITGKGSESWMCVKGGKKIPWDDRKIVKEEYEKIRDFRT